MRKIPNDFLDSFLGMSEEEAKRAIVAAGYTFRVTAKDGRFFICTADYKANRVNIQTFGGKVTSATVG